ncbi:hypothetical protein J5N97_015994 [Dioscorea zingiberensis]|uniref:CCHC-type domain-containing protein n=1 Tax=Dioscorea zingiberensis TaxID=325984 RepID=A0A9D5HEZ8_9LILI|nr:hypothetical protein J5N97_015994 [Dioscorea zingiberensis]
MITLGPELHHLPRILGQEGVELVVEFLNYVVKVDEKTYELDRGKYVRVCIEMKLDKPVRGVWVRKPFSSANVFVAAVYERLPLFCYKCGIIGHSENQCDQGEDGGQGNAPGTKPKNPDLKGKGTMTSDAGSSQRNTANPDTNAGEPINMQVDGGKGKNGILGRWTVVQCAERGGTHPQPAELVKTSGRQKPSRLEHTQTREEVG